MRLDRACDGGRGNRKRRAVRGPWGRQSQTPTSDASSKRPVAAAPLPSGRTALSSLSLSSPSVPTPIRSSVPVGTTTTTPAKLLVSFFRHHSSNAAGATPKPTSLALPPAARAALDCPGPRAQAPTCCLQGRGKHRWFKAASLCRGRWRMDFQQPDTVAHWLSLTCGSQTMDPARQACSFNAPC